MPFDFTPGEAEAPAAAYALDIAARMILRELAEVRGKGPWFGGLLNRVQAALATSNAPKDAPDAVKEAWDSAVHAAAYGVFSVVLGDKTVPDFRHDAAISGSGTPNAMLAPAVAAGYRIIAEVLAEAICKGPGGQEALRLLGSKAIGKAEVQNIPGDAKGTLKDRWVGASIAAIESIVDRTGGSDE